MAKKTYNILSSKWKHLLPEEGNFESEFARWKVHCNGMSEEKNYYTTTLPRC